MYENNLKFIDNLRGIYNRAVKIEKKFSSSLLSI